MLEIAERDLTAPTPVVTGFYIFRAEGIREIGNDVFAGIFG